MRPLLSILGLVFAASVLIANVNAIHCYVENPDEKLDKVDCDERVNTDEFSDMLAKLGLYISRSDTPTECGTAEVGREKEIYRDCLLDGVCEERDVDCTTRCDKDYCNGPSGATTSTPYAPLLIAIVASAITALGT